MKAIVKLMWVVLGAALLTGCATSGPKYRDFKATLPPLPEDQGRIFIYRTSAMGAAVQPAVRLNGEKIGKAVPKGFFYVDRPPGSYEVATKTEVKRTLSLLLDKGQTRFVRLKVSWGFFVGHVYPELVENAVAETEMAKCHYVEDKSVEEPAAAE